MRAVYGASEGADVVFQAADGVRVWSVTGVQTCALPILVSADARASRGFPTGLVQPGSRVTHRHLLKLPEALSPRAVRSEERRVGKTGRDRRAQGRGGT